MQRILFYVCVAFHSMNLAIAQDPTTSGKSPLNPDEVIANLALKYQDYPTATHAFLRLIETDPANATRWKISLISLYQSRKMNESALAVCEDLLPAYQDGKGDPAERDRVSELRAGFLQSVGRKEEARKAWKILFDQKATIHRSVKLAILQKDAQLYKEGLETIATGLKLAENPAEGDTTTMPIAKDSVEKIDIPVKAFLYYLKGLTLQMKDPKDLNTPMAAYSQAIAIAPDFAIARNQLASLLRAGN